MGNDVTTKAVSSLAFAFPPSRTLAHDKRRSAEKAQNSRFCASSSRKQLRLQSSLRYSKFKKTRRRPMTGSPPSSLASNNLRKFSRHCMMTKFWFWPIPIRSLIILKNVCRWLLSSQLKGLSQHIMLLSHQTRQDFRNPQRLETGFLRR